jgi:mono/diheme cytochrome c family protein
MVVVLGCVSNLFCQKEGGAIKRGRGIFDQNCSVCHNTDSNEKKIGPSLKGLFKRESMQNGNKPTEKNVLSLINDGATPMPSFHDILSDTEKEDLMAYLKQI